MGEIWLLLWAILAKFGAKMAIFDQSELGTLCATAMRRILRLLQNSRGLLLYGRL